MQRDLMKKANRLADKAAALLGAPNRVRAFPELKGGEEKALALLAAGHDEVACSWECPTCPPGAKPAKALLRPVIIDGALAEPLPTLAESRELCAESLKLIGPGHIVEYSRELLSLTERGRQI